MPVNISSTLLLIQVRKHLVVVIYLLICFIIVPDTSFSTVQSFSDIVNNTGRSS